MGLASLRRLIHDQRGGATVEFVAVVPFFLLIAFFALEITIAVFWIGTAEKAVQLGARLAVVSTPAVAITNTVTCPPAASSLPPTNCLASGFAYGQACSAGACTAFTNLTCVAGSGGACNSTNFTTIVNRMNAILSLIQGQYVTISYSYVGLGFAGGPIVPSVTVTLSGVPYGGVMTTILGSFFGRASPLVTLPTISATFTGEDLNSAGAS